MRHGAARSRGARSRLLAPIAVAVVVVLVIGGVAAGLTLVGRQPTGSGGPAAGGGSAGHHATAPAGGVLRLESAILSGRSYGPLRLTGSLPSTGPSHGLSYALPAGRAPEQLVARLARALGLTGTPRRVSGAWLVGGAATLQVSDGPGWQWSYESGRTIGVITPGCPPRPRMAPGAAAMECPLGTGRGVPGAQQSGAAGQSSAPGQAASSAGGADAVHAVHDALVALGEQHAQLSVRRAGPYATVTAARTVAGLPVAGFDTQFAVTSGQRIASASGWLAGAGGALDVNRSYPLVGAAQGYRRAANAPQGMHPDLCRARPGSSTAQCVGSEPRRVTGASYGLGLARTADGGALLVPAWLLQLAGGGGPLAVVAVTADHLQVPSNPTAPLRGSVG